MSQKNFINEKTKRSKVKQIYNYIKNKFGPSHLVIPEKKEKSMIKMIKDENLEESYLENNDIL